MDLKMEGSNIDVDTDVDTDVDVQYYNSSLKQASEIHLLLCLL